MKNPAFRERKAGFRVFRGGGGPPGKPQPIPFASTAFSRPNRTRPNPHPIGFGAQAQWFLAEAPEEGGGPWDPAHSRVAAMLGVAEADVVFVEPDLAHRIYPGPRPGTSGESFAVGQDCTRVPQDGSHGKVAGPDVFAWHLGDAYTQLGRARDEVAFADRRTRIAHIDTGYSRSHCTRPIS